MNDNYKFKIGDKVIITDASDPRAFDFSVENDLRKEVFIEGLTGTVVCTDYAYEHKAPSIGVRWDLSKPNALLHNCNGHCEYGYGRYVYKDGISLLSDVEETDSFNEDFCAEIDSLLGLK